MEISEAEAKVNALEAKKKGLIGQLLRVFGILRRKIYEAKAAAPFLKDKGGIRAWPLRRNLEELEFRIATEAYTPADEKEFLKIMKGVEKNLGEAVKVERVRRTKERVEGDLKRAEGEKVRIEAELTAIRKELKELRDFIREERKRKWEEGKRKRFEQERRKGRDDARRRSRAELEPYMKPLEDLSLEDVVVIERKNSA